MAGPLPMNGGDGEFSYAKNSTVQRGATNSVKRIMDEVIAQSLDVKQLLSTSKTFHVADVGCSVGPNTFASMEHVIEAVKLKCSTQGSAETPEFQVSFSDLPLNDFNTLFQSLPPQREFFAAGVPGSFYGRLFPKSSLHFLHCAQALHYLSQVPKEVLDRSSPAWNKGRISFVGASAAVQKAYLSQFVKDIEAFLSARAQELVVGGMMVLAVQTIRSDLSYTDLPQRLIHEILGSALHDMAREGVVSQNDVDSFNFAVFVAPPEKWKELVERNGNFKIEKMQVTSVVPLSNAPFSGRFAAMHCRAVVEGTLSQHFGREKMDEVFDRFQKKAEVLSSRLASGVKESTQLFLALKRI